MEFRYAGHKVVEYIDGRQFLVFKIRCLNDAFPIIKIINCIFEVFLHSHSEKTSIHIGKIGIFPAMGCPTPWIVKNEEVSLECYIPLNPTLIEKLLEARARGLIHFEISANFSYEYYSEDKISRTPQGIYTSYLPNSGASSDIIFSFDPSGKKKNGVTFTTDESKNLLEKLKHYELVRFEIAVPREIGGLEGAAKQLKSAEINLRENKLREALLDIRQALTKHLMEKVDEGNKVWKLKDSIKEKFLEKSPTEMEDSYKEILKRVEETLRQQIRIINDIFLHEDSDKLKAPPLREDVEGIFFIVSFATKYLALRISG